MNLVTFALLVIGSNAIFESKVKNANTTEKEEYLVSTRNKWDPLLTDSNDLQIDEHEVMKN